MTTMRILLFFSLLSFSFCAKTCHDADLEIECHDRTSYMICEYDYITRQYKNDTVVPCPKGTSCVCMVGEDCAADQMCRVRVEPKSFVDSGMMTWKKKSLSDCSGCWESSREFIRGFSYKLPTGRMFKEELSIRKDRQKKSEVLYIPTADAFIKYEWSGYCKKSKVKKTDPLVMKDLEGFRLKSSSGRKQHWEKKYLNLGAAEEEYWNYHVKEYKGKLVPKSYNYEFSQDGLGDGGSDSVSYTFTYYPELLNYKNILQREQQLINKCEN